MKRYSLILILATVLTLCACSEKNQKEVEVLNSKENVSSEVESSEAESSENENKTVAEEDIYQYGSSNNKYNILTRDYGEKKFLLGPIDEVLGIYCYDDTDQSWLLCASGDAVLGPIYKNYLYYIFLPRNGDGDNIEIRRLNLESHEKETIYEYIADSDASFNSVMIYEDKMFLNYNGQLETGVYAELDDHGKLKKEFAPFQELLGNEYREGKYMLSGDYEQMFFFSETDKEVFTVNSSGRFSKLNINDAERIILITDRYVMFQDLKGSAGVFDAAENQMISTWEMPQNITLLTYDSEYFYGGIREEDKLSIVSIDREGNIKNLFILENVVHIDRLGFSISNGKAYFYDLYSNSIVAVDLQAGEFETVK